LDSKMTWGPKIVGFLLIAAVVIAPLTTGVWAEAESAAASQPGLGDRPAMCHKHQGTTAPVSNFPHSPHSVPPSYQCCLTGHDAAVVQASDSPQPAASRACITVHIEPALMLSLSGLKGAILPSADSPGTTPLRI
jgi:hypothetical protein